MPSEPEAAPVVFTIGHSNRTLDELVDLLRAHDVSLLVDVRTIPRSRTNPQFNADTLSSELAIRGISYVHMKELGGLRRPHKDSVNTAWRNLSFRGYADYMQTREFENALDRLINLAQTERITLMCAEALPWRCHRSLIADALLVRGLEVIDLISKTSSRHHAMTPWAVVEGMQVRYPAPAEGESA